MSPIGKRHAACVKRLNRMLSDQIGREAIVSVQDPVRVGMESEPQPELALLRWRSDFYVWALPEAGDAQLVVEVAESSGHTDRLVKVPLYARGGVPEVWLVDLAGDDAYSSTANNTFGFANAGDYGTYAVFDQFLCMGVFLDSGGTDSYDRPDVSIGIEDDSLWTNPPAHAEMSHIEKGGGMDAEGVGNGLCEEAL